MNCLQFAQWTSFDCTPIRTNFGEDGLFVALPFSYIDGSPASMYIVPAGDQIRLTDGGDTLFHLQGAGFRILHERKRWTSLKDAVSAFGVSISKSGEIEVLVRPHSLAAGTAKFTAAMLATTNWEVDHLYQPVDGTMLFEEIKDYLIALRPEAIIIENRSVTGISGREYVFPMSMNGVLVDAMGLSPQATASMIRRLVDIRAIPSQQDIDIEIAVDDRDILNKPVQDIKLLEILAMPLKVTDIIRGLERSRPSMLM